ncbi:helix-turn-helix transcriptional regulator [Crocinitomix algicola]|uniref:helix-turn-helix transcriptional regulator n=1 Tax=Crocinitomix algicola TaxID=1740263 RepID=UPI00082FBF58|nr:WYL domain-containing protein [Crocinitomix algicola]
MSRIKNAQIRYRIIDRLIRNQYNPFPTKEDLRRACEEALYGSDSGADICDSTIEKDLFAMRMDFDAPIKYSKRDKGYYYEDEDFSIDKIPLSQDDIDAIKFASNTLMQFRDVGIFKQFGFAIDKIFDRVHISSNPTDANVENYVQFETVHDTGKGNEMLPDFLKAIQEKQVVSFLYTSYVSEKTKPRRVLPLLLKEYRNRWYLICFSLDKEKVMTFGLDRMANLQVTEDTYLQKIEFDAENYFKNSIGITANDSLPEKVIFKVDKIGSKYLESQPLHASQKLIKEGKSRNTFSLKVIVSEELKRTVLSYGSQIEVVKPKELREEIKIKVLEMHEIYG